jgi:hypothetical protein
VPRPLSARYLQLAISFREKRQKNVLNASDEAEDAIPGCEAWQPLSDANALERVDQIERLVPASDGSDDFIGLRRSLTNSMRG